MQTAISVHLEPSAEAVGLARNAVRQTLDGRLRGEKLSDMELLVSEVVTNGIRHGVGRVDLEVLVGDDRALVRCLDDGAGIQVESPEPRADGTGGYGLFLVDCLAERWGVERDDRSCIWFELAT